MEEILNQITPIIRLFFGVIGAVVTFIFLPWIIVIGIAGWLTRCAADERESARKKERNKK